MCWRGVCGHVPDMGLPPRKKPTVDCVGEVPAYVALCSSAMNCGKVQKIPWEIHLLGDKKIHEFGEAEANYAAMPYEHLVGLPRNFYALMWPNAVSV